MKIIQGGVTIPKGFKANGTAAGIKKNTKDMALIYSELPCVAAGVFTTNQVKAAPVKWDYHVVNDAEFAQAVVINSGVANACTGIVGTQCCESMAEITGRELSIPKESVLVASTGVIGKQLPMDLIEAGIKQLVPGLKNDLAAGTLAAEAIMTTDTKSKEAAVSIEIGGRTVTIAGMCKGSGMIHPNMATMLCFLTTDAAISKEMLDKVLKDNVKDTFNMISVDGDTSTNDSVLVLANGKAENPQISQTGADYDTFYAAFDYVMTCLSKMIAGDGEGATCLLEVKVEGAENKEQAVLLSKSIVTSSLTKTAIFGHDANWGRVLCAMGYAGVSFDPDLVDIYFESKAGKLKIVENGMAADYSESEATDILSQEEVTIIADLKSGEAKATAWGCDLTYDYVKINADYRS